MESPRVCAQRAAGNKAAFLPAWRLGPPTGGPLRTRGDARKAWTRGSLPMPCGRPILPSTHCWVSGGRPTVGTGSPPEALGRWPGVRGRGWAHWQGLQDRRGRPSGPGALRWHWLWPATGVLGTGSSGRGLGRAGSRASAPLGPPPPSLASVATLGGEVPRPGPVLHPLLPHDPKVGCPIHVSVDDAARPALLLAVPRPVMQELLRVLALVAPLRRPELVLRVPRRWGIGRGAGEGKASALASHARRHGYPHATHAVGRQNPHNGTPLRARTMSTLSTRTRNTTRRRCCRNEMIDCTTGRRGQSTAMTEGFNRGFLLGWGGERGKANARDALEKHPTHRKPTHTTHPPAERGTHPSSPSWNH